MYKLITLLFWYLVGVTNFCSGKDLSSKNDEPIPNPNQIASSDTKPPVGGERIPDIGPLVGRGGIARFGLVEVAVKKCLSNIADCTSDAGIAIDQTRLASLCLVLFYTRQKKQGNCTQIVFFVINPTSKKSSLNQVYFESYLFKNNPLKFEIFGVRKNY